MLPLAAVHPDGVAATVLHCRVSDPFAARMMLKVSPLVDVAVTV